MSTQQVVERILSDARAEAESIISEAENKAAAILAAASSRAEEGRRTVETEVKEKKESIFEKKAAAARLEGAKILLSEKRKVVDGIYEKALQRLCALSKEDSLRLISMLLEKYAETNDELFFADNFSYKAEVALLPVFTEKQLRVSSQTLPLDGGLRLKGVRADKDLSYGALLAADRDEHQATLALELFK